MGTYDQTTETEKKKNGGGDLVTTDGTKILPKWGDAIRQRNVLGNPKKGKMNGGLLESLLPINHWVGERTKKSGCGGVTNGKKGKNFPRVRQKNTAIPLGK